jgi:NAD-dependent SIR2 family protein deacetylase
MKRRVQIEVWECECVQCGHPLDREKPWYSLAKRPPQECPRCGSREWDGKKIKRKPQAKPRVNLPKPIRVRSIDNES